MPYLSADLEKACCFVEELRSRVERQYEAIEAIALRGQDTARDEVRLGILRVSLAEAVVRRDAIDVEIGLRGLATPTDGVRPASTEAPESNFPTLATL